MIVLMLQAGLAAPISREGGGVPTPRISSSLPEEPAALPGTGSGGPGRRDLFTVQPDSR